MAIDIYRIDQQGNAPDFCAMRCRSSCTVVESSELTHTVDTATPASFNSIPVVKSFIGTGGCKPTVNYDND